MDKTPFEMSGSLIKFTEKIIASARNPFGHFDGPDVVFGAQSRFKSTVPGLLAGVRLLNSKDTLIRKISFGKDSKLASLTAFQLQEQFNTILGIKGRAQTSMPVRLLKGIFASCCKISNKGFPGGFIHSLRARNGVKSDYSVLTLMGWIPKIVSQTKLSDVLFNTVDVSYATVDGKTTVVGRSMQNISLKGRNMSFQEFRTAVALTAPRIDFDSEVPFDTQIKKEPLDYTSVKELKTVSLFADPKLQLCVNLSQQTYALKVSIPNKGSKTTITHYENSRNRFLASTANITIRDSKGKSYDSFSSLPQKAQDYMRKKYRYPVKRSAEEPPTEEGDAMITDAPQGETQSAKVAKKAKFNKRQAAEKRAAVGNRVTRSQTK